MTTPSTKAELPLDDLMLAMDVVDTLRHNHALVENELDSGNRDQRLIERLRRIYEQQGIEVPDDILAQGVTALKESRFAYEPAKGGFGVTLAKLYVTRGSWGRAVLAVILAMVVVFGGYFLAWKPYQASQIEAARIELSEEMPKQMDTLYSAIFQEAKVQSAITQASDYVTRGKAAVAEGDRDGALDAIQKLTVLRDKIRQEFMVRVVNRQGEQSGFWTFPETSRDATNYYIVVEALDSDGNALSLPIKNEESGDTEDVSKWGLRVSQAVYESVLKDKKDDGIIQRNIVGMKQYGFLDIDYMVPVMGGTLTQW